MSLVEQRERTWVGRQWGRVVSLMLLAACGGGTLAGAEDRVDLSQGVIVAPAEPTVLRKAAELLHEEIFRRTRLDLPVRHTLPAADQSAIVLGSLDTFVGENPPAWPKENRPAEERREALDKDRYAISTQVSATGAARVTILGQTDRAALFGAGRLLRLLTMGRDKLSLPEATQFVSGPAYPLRGHQLGYRPKVNTYDAWTEREFEQYLRDLVVFGTNAIEILPPKTDDYADSPHFALPKEEMMVRLCRLIADYDLDVWIWYPAIDGDYTDPKVTAAGQKRRGEILAQLPRVDAMFVPGGDPGRTPPEVFVSLMTEQGKLLRKHHPQAKLWVSWQGYRHPEGWLETFYQSVARSQQIDGVVYGPWTKDSLADFRRQTPDRLPLRLYPDITHSIRCQYPAPNWDPAYQYTEHREVINPRPTDFTRIYREEAPGTVGFLAYSEGVNDDANKILWSNLAWDPTIDPLDNMREYARYFIGEEQAEEFAAGLLELEQNWQGPLLTNRQPVKTLARFQRLEEAATPQLRRNWRWQMAVYRAYYDAYVQARLVRETALEQEAAEFLRKIKPGEESAALVAVDRHLAAGLDEGIRPEWRERIHELGEALFQSIGMQSSVPRHGAQSYGRGAHLDLVDNPVRQRQGEAPFQVPPSKVHPLHERLIKASETKDAGEQQKEIAELTSLLQQGP